MESFLIGNRLTLRGLREQDLKEDAPYFGWLNDLSLDSHNERSAFPNSMDRMISYYQKACKNQDLVLLGIYDNASQKHIGNISIKNINWHSRNGWLGYLIGDHDFHNQGVATEASMMFTYYCFNKLNLHRVCTSVTESNIASIKVLEKSGYQKEGVMKEHMMIGGKARDVMMYGAVSHAWEKTHSEKAKKLFKQTNF